MDRLEQIQNYFHDMKIKIETAEKCGKFVVHTSTLANLVDAMEQLTKEIRRRDKSGSN